MKHLSWLGCMLVLLGSGCDSRDNDGTPCDLDSDCGAGSWCDAVTQLCTPIECSEGFCDLPDGYSTQGPVADESNPELEALQEEVEKLKDEVEDLKAGTSSEECKAYKDPELQAWRITSFSLGTSAIEGHGFDMDGDPDTCFPEENVNSGILPCEKGIDNAIAGLAGIVNPLLEASLPPVAMAYSPTCDILLFPEEEPDVTAFTPISMDEDNQVTGVTLTEDSLTTAGGGEWIVLIPLPFAGGSTLRVKGTEIRVEASWNAETNECWSRWKHKH